MEEKQLISELKNGNQPAFKLLIELFGCKVFNICLNLLQSNEDAEDISQEVFVSIFQSINQFKEESKLSTWIYRIAVTKSLDHIRMKKRKKRFAFFQLISNNDYGETKVDIGHFDHPGVKLENKERSKILFKAIDTLPENQKSAFVLHKIEDLSYREIAEILATSLSSVESLIFRAKKNLRKTLLEYYEKNEK